MLVELAAKGLLALAAAALAKQHDIAETTARNVLNYLAHFGRLDVPELSTTTPNPEEVSEAGLVAAQDLVLSVGGSVNAEDWPTQVERLIWYPRCGNPDNMIVTEEARWRKTALTYQIQSYVIGVLSRQDQDDLLALAFKQWTDHTGITATRATSSQRADIVVSSGRGGASGFDGPQGVLAWCQLPSGDDRQIQLKFDADEQWLKEATSPGILYLNVACHELGHGLGLEHSQVNGALMAPFYAPGITKPQQRDDITRIQALYGAGTPPPPPPTGGYAITIRGTGNIPTITTS